MCPNEKNLFIVPNNKKERRLLQESTFILFDRWTLILKKLVEKSFSYETKARILCILWGECVMVSTNKRKWYYCKNPCLSLLTDELWFEGKWWNKSFSWKPKHKYYASTRGICLRWPITKIKLDYYKNPCLSYLTNVLWL